MKELTTNKWTLYSTLRRLDINLSLYLEGMQTSAFDNVEYKYIFGVYNVSPKLMHKIILMFKITN